MVPANSPSPFTERAATTTFTPRRASASAARFPIPLLAPVMRAILPERSRSSCLGPSGLGGATTMAMAFSILLLAVSVMQRQQHSYLYSD
jgi:hypothetical protein